LPRRSTSSNLPFVVWEVQCDAAHRILAVFYVAEETNEDVEEHDDAHGPIQNSEITGEVLGSFHVVFQSNHLKQIARA